MLSVRLVFSLFSLQILSSFGMADGNAITASRGGSQVFCSRLGVVHTVFRIKLPVKQVDRYDKIL